MIGIKDIQEAAAALNRQVHRTPLIHSNSFSTMTGADVYLKAENLQKTGSFKVRGAFNKLRTVESGRVIAASMGNHAQGVAYAAAMLGLHSTIVMPVTAPLIKQEATKGYGAELLLHGENFEEALTYAKAQKDYTFIHAYDDKSVIAGQGTIGLEIIEDLSDADAVIVPVGGGGLISGIASAVKALSPETEIIGVQTASAASACQSFCSGKVIACRPCYTIADGIAVGSVGDLPFAIIKNNVDDMISVSEDSIAMAILLFMERKKLVVEGAGAVTLAALLENSDRFRGRKVVLVISGGNIDFMLIDRIIHKGLAGSGRIGMFEVIIDDMPGKLHIITGIIAGHRGNIHSVDHDRLSSGLSVHQTRVIFTVETRGREHMKNITDSLRIKGFTVKELT